MTRGDKHTKQGTNIKNKMQFINDILILSMERLQLPTTEFIKMQLDTTRDKAT
jgi:hypothetical protein